MEENKRKKPKKKKNRSGPLEDLSEAAATPSSEIPEVTLSDREADARPAAVATAEEGAAPNEPSSVLQGSGLSPEDPALLRVELCQIVQELRSAFNSEARNSPALCVLIEDIRTCHATSQANLDHLIEQLRGEVLHLNQAASSQRNKEVDLEGVIQLLREEVLHLKVRQEAESERKAAEYAEIQQLREEMVKLSDGSIKQLRMVEEMSDIIHQLLKHGQSPVAMDTCQLAYNSTPPASEAGVISSSEKLEVNGHHVLIDQLESHTKSRSAQTESFEAEKIAYCAPSADPLVVEKLSGAHGREVSAVDSTLVEAQRIQTKPGDDFGLFANSTEFVTVNHLREGENDLHHDFIPEIIHSDSPQHAHMQATDLKPLSDAPITGAPVRLFRFVARYVSGADLVK